MFFQENNMFNTENIKPLYVATRGEWRSWLETNFEKEKDIWLFFPHKATGKPVLLYNDAVEEALCFGWIDSTVKSYDGTGKIQRFSRRNPKSGYSQQNKERLKWLLKNEMVHPSIIETVKNILKKKFIFPDDILDEIRKDNEAWKNYSKFSDTYKRIRIAYIDDARKRPEEFDKRLKNFIKKTRDNKLIGFGGIDKYF